MRRSALVSSVAICLCFGASAPLLAAQPSAAGGATPATAPIGASLANTTDATPVQPAEACLNDVRSFSGRMQKDGYWLGASDYGYGYPMGGYGYSMPIDTDSMGYSSARPGYEVRALVAAANILAQHGQQQACEAILATTRTVYQTYATQMHERGVGMADGPNWRRQQIANAQPVAGQTTLFRSDQLLDTDVLSAQGESLGTVHDIVMSTHSGKIAYLVIGRGGLFGIDEKFVPVPWTDFKATPGVSVLELDTTKAVLQAAPEVSDDGFGTDGQFAQESQKVDAYWKIQIAAKDSN